MTEPINGLHDGSDLHWGAVHAFPGFEAVGMSSAVQLGLECFCPRYVAMVPCGGPPGTKRKVLKCLFPGYFFFGTDEGCDRWKELFRAEGVIRPLMSSDRTFAPVRYDFLISLAGEEDKLVAGFKRMSYWKLKPHDLIRVGEGQFSGLYGELTAIDERGRIEFLLNLLGRKVPIRGMHADQVEAV